jgi:PadR family transcriptional regulator PadR
LTSRSDEQSETLSELTQILSDFSQFYILLLLSEGPVHGYGLIKEFKKRTGKSLSAGTLYPFLQKLVTKGLVSQTDVSVGKRPKLTYSLTKKGKRFCENLFERFAAIAASAIEPTLKTCASCGVRIYEGGHFEDMHGKTLAFCCSHCAAAYKRQLSK